MERVSANDEGGVMKGKMYRRASRRSAIVMILLAFSLAVSSAVGGAGAARSIEAGKPVVYYLAPTLEDDYESAAARTLQTLGPTYGFQIKTLNADKRTPLQVEQMDNAISQKPAAIILNATDPTALTGEAQKARAAGIPVIALDRTMESAKLNFTSTVGTVVLGRIAAGEVAKLLKGRFGSYKGNVLEVMGDPSDSYSVDIAKGFKQGIAKYRQIQVTLKPTPNYDLGLTASIVDDQLSAGRKIDLIFLHADFRIASVISTLKSHNLTKGQVILVGSDGTGTALQTIRQGWTAETIGDPTTAEVAGSLRWLQQIIAGKPVKPGVYTVKGITGSVKNEKWGPTFYVPGQIITRKNVNDPTLWGNQKKK